MAKVLSPLDQQFFDDSGSLLVGGKIFVYEAGSSTKATTYTDSGGLSSNPNPLILGADARAVFWLTSGTSYKFVIAPSTDTDPPASPLQTIDNVTGVETVAATQSEWVESGLTPTRISDSSFSVVGDQTAILTPARRLKTVDSGGTDYSTITASSFGAGITTVTVNVDSAGIIDAGISTVAYSILDAAHDSEPGESIGETVASAATTDIGATAGQYITVSGVVTITSLGNAPQKGMRRLVLFSGALTLTHSATLILPSAANILTAANDLAEFVAEDTAGTWRCLRFIRYNGMPVKGMSKLVTSTYNIATASGSQAITGIGFTPTSVVAVAGISGASTQSVGAGNASVSYCQGYNGAGTIFSPNLILAASGAGAYSAATIGSFAYDTVNLTWTKTGAPTGTIGIVLICQG